MVSPFRAPFSGRLRGRANGTRTAGGCPKNSRGVSHPPPRRWGGRSRLYVSLREGIKAVRGRAAATLRVAHPEPWPVRSPAAYATRHRVQSGPATRFNAAINVYRVKPCRTV